MPGPGIGTQQKHFNNLSPNTLQSRTPQFLEQINMNHGNSISHFFKKSIKFLISLSLFSFIFSYSSLLHSFKVHFPAFTMQIFGYTIDKNYMFLLCNGILVVIVRNSGLIGSCSPPKTHLNGEPAIKIKGDAQREVPELSVDKEVEEQRANKLLITTQDEDGDQEIVFTVTEEEGIGLLTTEELHKRCEDFVKKMKEGIKIEPKQLIMA